MEVLWNIFSLYVLIISRINCTVDFALRKNFRRDVPNSKPSRDSKLAADFEKADPKNSKIYNNNLPSAPKPVVPIRGGLFCSNCNRDLSHDINAIAVTGRNVSALHKPLKVDPSAQNNNNSYNNNNNNNNKEVDVIQVVEESSSMIEETTVANAHHSCESRWMTIGRNCSEFGYLNLILFSMNLLTSVFFTVKLTVYSLAGIYAAEVAARKLPFLTTTATPIEKARNTLLRSLLALVSSDIFENFNNSGLLNIFALTLLLPGTCERVRSLRRVLQKICRNTSCDRPNQSEMSIVQLNLSYMNALGTTAYKWGKLLRQAPFHHHSYKTLQEEATAILRVITIKDGSQTCIELKTKMYAFNMIQFNSCFARYFNTDPDDELEAEDHEDAIVLGESLGSLEVDSDEMKTPSKSVDQNYENSIPVLDENQTPSIKLSEREKYNEIFLAKPIHRVDLDQMFWMLLPLLSIYIIAPLQILVSIWTSLNVSKRKERIRYSNLELLSIGKIIQVCIWRALNTLTTFDIYNFYSCCLICFSRARYLRKILSQFLEACIELTCKMAENKLAVEGYVIQMEGTFSNMAEILNYKVKKADICTLNNKEFGTRYIHTINLNQKAEFIIDLALLLQFELADLKRFFTSYLNAELSLKILGTVFAVTALLGCGSAYEFAFNLITCLTATIPLLVSLVMAAMIEYEFRSICKLLSRVLACGSQVITPKNMKRMTKQVDHLTIKTNRSFVVANYFSVSIGGLATLFGWVVTGVLLLTR